MTEKLTENCAKPELMFINHASLLIKYGDRFLLTDPWFERPAFGSWLPTFPQYVHPSYLVALGQKLSILISHGHDDHFDDDFISMFDKDTEIITANFKSPSVINRLKKLGFSNVLLADRVGVKTLSGFKIKSYIDENRSFDDAIYTIEVGTGLVIHCNDNWYEFTKDTFEGINSDVSRCGNDNSFLFSQTNSASGYPLNYRNFSDEEKSSMLFNKVLSMIKQGLKNSQRLGLNTFFSYAGFASVFVKDKPAYLDLGLIPTSRFVYDHASVDPELNYLLEKVTVADFYPGDILHLIGGDISKAFISSHNYNDVCLKNATLDYYQVYNVKSHCDTYSLSCFNNVDLDLLHFFLDGFNNFVVKKLEQTGSVSFSTALGKVFQISVTDSDVVATVIFGEGVVLGDKKIQPNKKLYVTSELLMRVLTGDILFENLYTGYEGEWERTPVDVYNRELVMFIVMYSYVYKNRLIKNYIEK